MLSLLKRSYITFSENGGMWMRNLVRGGVGLVIRYKTGGALTYKSGGYITYKRV